VLCGREQWAAPCGVEGVLRRCAHFVRPVHRLQQRPVQCLQRLQRLPLPRAASTAPKAPLSLVQHLQRLQHSRPTGPKFIKLLHFHSHTTPTAPTAYTACTGAVLTIASTAFTAPEALFYSRCSVSGCSASGCFGCRCRSHYTPYDGMMRSMMVSYAHIRAYDQEAPWYHTPWCHTPYGSITRRWKPSRDTPWHTPVTPWRPPRCSASGTPWRHPRRRAWWGPPWRPLEAWHPPCLQRARTMLGASRHSL
jgi:hypothetical protein